MTRIFNMPVILIFFVISVLLYDIGNSNAPRQGTEGFYLKVSKETFQAGNFLTPIHTDKPHWSKPPLLFVLPFPFYVITKPGDLWSARVSVLLVSLFFIALLASLFTKLLNRPELKFEFALYFITSLVFVKYSRIFMNEALLLLIPLVSNLYIFKYLSTQNENKNYKSLYLAIFFAVIASYSKGPVSIIGQFLPSAIYLFLFERTKLLHFFKIFVTPVLCLSMLWITYEFIVYGDEFYQYFFIRENLGKFTSRSYPLHVVLVGTLLFALPWSLSLINLKKIFLFLKINTVKTENSNLIIFLAMHTIVLVLFWTLPSQRSHHYGIPACGHLLLFLYCLLINTKFPFKMFFSVLMTLSLIILSLVICLAYLKIISPYHLFILIISSMIGLIFYKKLPTPIAKISILNFLLFSQIWLVLGPSIYLPLLPEKVITVLKNEKTIFASYRKPFYLEELLQRSVSAIDPSVIAETIIKHPNDVHITSKEYLSGIDPNSYTIIESWSVWARGVNLNKAWQALQANDLGTIQDTMYLIRPHRR